MICQYSQQRPAVRPSSSPSTPNDLTRTTFGVSRDDAETGFLVDYMENHILPRNPFTTIDREGVGELMAMAVQKGRSINPELE